MSCRQFQAFLQSYIFFNFVTEFSRFTFNNDGDLPFWIQHNVEFMSISISELYVDVTCTRKDIPEIGGQPPLASAVEEESSEEDTAGESADQDEAILGLDDTNGEFSHEHSDEQQK